MAIPYSCRASCSAINARLNPEQSLAVFELVKPSFKNFGGLNAVHVLLYPIEYTSERWSQIANEFNL
jgi:hypothetical protein